MLTGQKVALKLSSQTTDNKIINHSVYFHTSIASVVQVFTGHSCGSVTRSTLPLGFRNNQREAS